MTAFDNLRTRYRANPRIYQAGICFIVCVVLHNFPWLLDVLPEGAREKINLAVSLVIDGGIGLLAIFLTKQFNTSGTGAPADPYTKASPSSPTGVKTIVPALAAMCALSLGGCTTTENADGTRTTRFDAKAASEIIETGSQLYDQYQAADRAYVQPLHPGGAYLQAPAMPVYSPVVTY